MWTHSGATRTELAVYDTDHRGLQRLAGRVRGRRTVVPAGLDYNDIVAGAAQGGLPCLLDVDGPSDPVLGLVGILAAARRLAGAGRHASCRAHTGYWNDQLYSIGYWDAAVANYARKSVLEANGIRIPTLEEPWTLEEFDAALETLKATGEFDYAWDIGMRDSVVSGIPTPSHRSCSRSVAT